MDYSQFVGGSYGLVVNDAVSDVSDDSSTVALPLTKMEELELKNGDSVILAGKKRKSTAAVVVGDNTVNPGNIRMNKVIRSNLRYFVNW